MHCGTVVIMRSIEPFNEKLKRTVAHKVNGLHWLFPNVRSMSNKENEIKMLVKESRYDLTYIIEMKCSKYDNQICRSE